MLTVMTRILDIETSDNTHFVVNIVYDNKLVC